MFICRHNRIQIGFAGSCLSVIRILPKVSYHRNRPWLGIDREFYLPFATPPRPRNPIHQPRSNHLHCHQSRIIRRAQTMCRSFSFSVNRRRMHSDNIVVVLLSRFNRCDEALFKTLGTLRGTPILVDQWCRKYRWRQSHRSVLRVVANSLGKSIVFRSEENGTSLRVRSTCNRRTSFTNARFSHRRWNRRENLQQEMARQSTWLPVSRFFDLTSPGRFSSVESILSSFCHRINNRWLLKASESSK